MRITYRFGSTEKVFERDTTQVIIGRPKEGVVVDLDLTPDLTVSRPHARILLEEGEYWIEDLGSTRGTLVAGEEIKGKGKRRLQPGETIRIGETTLKVDTPAIKVEVALPQPPPAAELLPRIAHTLDAVAPALSPAADATNDAARRLSLLYDLPLQLAEQSSLDNLLQKVVERLVDIIPGAARGALVVKEQGTGNLLLKAHVPPGEPAISTALARRAMEQQQGFIWKRGETEDSFSISLQDIATGMYAPLLWKGQVLGVVCVDNRNSCSVFCDEDLRLMLAVSQQAALAVATRQLQESLRLNATLLERLLTNFSPKIRESLLQRARHGRLRPGGRKSEVSILFSDIRGFTRLSAAMDVEDVVDMLNEYFPALVDPIFKNDGTIDKFVGDAILAVFGSPETDLQHHHKAVLAALDMQEKIADLNRTRARHGETVCSIGIGVHCGEVLHGFVGSADRMEFTVIGDAVNRASRYCEGAGAGEVLISEELYQRVWKTIRAEETTVSTKHEGNFCAYRVRGLK